jgi:hypothetical protein
VQHELDGDDMERDFEQRVPLGAAVPQPQRHREHAGEQLPPHCSSATTEQEGGEDRAHVAHGGERHKHTRDDADGEKHALDHVVPQQPPCGLLSDSQTMSDREREGERQ